MTSREDPRMAAPHAHGASSVNRCRGRCPLPDHPDQHEPANHSTGTAARSWPSSRRRRRAHPVGDGGGLRHSRWRRDRHQVKNLRPVPQEARCEDSSRSLHTPAEPAPPARQSVAARERPTPTAGSSCTRTSSPSPMAKPVRDATPPTTGYSPRFYAQRQRAAAADAPLPAILRARGRIFTKILERR